MTGSWLSFVIELIVAGLLATTIGYCVLLNRKLSRLRDNETMLRQTIAELIGATDNAERAIAGLRNTVKECDIHLSDRIRTAERFTADMDKQLRAGRDVIERIAQIAEAARISAAPRVVRNEAPVLVVARGDAVEGGVAAPRAVAEAGHGPRTGATVAAAAALAERTRLRAAG